MRSSSQESIFERMKRDVAELITDESGLTTLEYTLLLALIAVAVIFAYREFGRATSHLASDSTESLPMSERSLSRHP